MKKIRYGGLTAVIINLYIAYGSKHSAMSVDERLQGLTQMFNDLSGVVDEFLVNAQTMVLEVNAIGKSHHAGEYPTSKTTAHYLIAFFLSDQRPGMETMSFESQFQFGTLKVGDDARDVMRLVVKHHSEDIEARIGVGVLKPPRFIDEYA